jgi:hypothetical protein
MAAAALALVAAPGAPATPHGPSRVELARLAADLDGVESVRAVKRLQTAYAQYAQAGLWHEMAGLFAEEAEFVHGAVRVHGREAVGRYLLAAIGHGREGIAAGALHTQMIVRPIVNVGADGMTAKGRWSELSMSGRFGGEADWAGGLYENDYVRERGVWKIARSAFVPMFSGPYATGWRSDPSAPVIVPYHFTPDEAGQPVAPGRVAHVPAKLRLTAVERRVNALVEEDLVLNLQNAYGHYVDRKMWDDVVDLFDEDGAIEIADVGIYRGKSGIRRALELAGPAGLRRGELNEHPLFDTIVVVDPTGRAARARGLQMSLLGDATAGTASIGLAVFESRFRKTGGGWRIRELRLYPYMNTDYYQGWAKIRLPPSRPPSALAPDQPSRDPAASANATIPEIFYANPVTGRMPAYPAGAAIIALGPLAPARKAGARSVTEAPDRLAEVRRKLAIAAAYDGVENISSAFGTWNDDLQWDKFAALFARDGWRGKAFVGFYIGPERIRRAEILSRGTTKTATTVSALHFRMQPVIDVAPDGRSAKLRSRYMQLTSGAQVAGTFGAGIYANDAAVLQDGVWKFANAAIDDAFFASTSYQDGWARPKSQPGGNGVPPWTARLVREIPPDIPNSAMPFRQQGAIAGSIIQWPEIRPMFFHYRNPVSGRVPPYYCPDEKTCDPAMAGLLPAKAPAQAERP